MSTCASVHAKVGAATKHIRVCTSCLRSGKSRQSVRTEAFVRPASRSEARFRAAALFHIDQLHVEDQGCAPGESPPDSLSPHTPDPEESAAAVAPNFIPATLRPTLDHLTPASRSSTVQLPDNVLNSLLGGGQ